MKVHIYTPAYFPKLVGMTYAAHGHALLLKDLGADVTIIAPASGGVYSNEALDAGYKLKTFAIAGTGLPWNLLRGDILNFLCFAQKEHPDFIISEGWYTWGTQLLPKVRPHCGHALISSHGSADKLIGGFSPLHIVRSLAYRYIESFQLDEIFDSLSAAIVLTKWEDNDRFRDAHQFRRRSIPVCVCPNYSVYTPALTDRTLPKIKRLLHVGEMLPNKNQMLAVQLLSDLPKDFELELAFPAETWYFREVKQTINTLRLGPRVHYTIGRNREELESSFDKASALLILSRSEAQPIVAVDALCKGLPFVSSPVGCMAEMLGGIVSSPAGLKEAILSIHASPAIYKNYSAAALRFYEQNYEFSKSRRALQQLINSLNG